MSYRIEVSIEGVAPILFSRWTEQAEDSLRTGSTGGKKSDAARVEEALQKVYRDGAGGLVLPAWNMKKCLLDGASRGGLKEGKKGLAQFIAATVFIESDPSFGVAEPDYIDERSGRRPPRTGGACLVKRPALRTGWQLAFVLNVLDDRRDPAALRQALDEAGLLVGLGSFRPEFGRFLVRRWAVLPMD